MTKAVLNNGTIHIRKISPTGVKESTTITIPQYSSKQERDEIVMDLLKNHVQDDVTDFMGLSQSTIHNIKKRNS